MTASVWDAVHERLRETLADLPDGGILLVGEPVLPLGPRQGLLRRRPKPPPVRYVQYLRTGEYLARECVGAASFGGGLPLTSEQDRAIRAVGGNCRLTAAIPSQRSRTRIITAPSVSAKRMRPRAWVWARSGRSGCAPGT